MKKVLLKILKFTKWFGIILLSLLILLMIELEIFDRYLATEKGAFWLFDKVKAQPQAVKFTPSGVRYMEIGDPAKPALLLIHGAPGSLFDWKGVAEKKAIYEKYRLLIIERPGYGGTRPRKAEPSIKIQAERIAEILDTEKQPAMVMGHSYGGPIAVILGAIKPAKIKKIIGVAGQYDPDNEKTFQISHFINFKLFRFLLPKLIWASNVEKLTHPDGLREIMSYYKEVKPPVMLIHGDKDTLVPYENSPFVQKLLPEGTQMITFPNGDHPLHMQESQYLVDFVLKN